MDRLRLAWHQHQLLWNPLRFAASVSTWIGHQSLNRAVIFLLLFLFISLNLIDLQDMLRFYRHKTYLRWRHDASESTTRRQVPHQPLGAGGPGGVSMRESGKQSHAPSGRLNHRDARRLRFNHHHRRNGTGHGRRHHPKHYLLRSTHRYLVHTPNCHMIEWPLFDEETGPLVGEYREKQFHCTKPTVRIERVNNTAIYVDGLAVRGDIQCFAREVLLSAAGDSFTFGRQFGPLKAPATDFANLNAVQVECFKPMRALHLPLKMLAKVESKVLPLVPHKSPKYPALSAADQPNVLLLGIDSVSWLNFRRYFKHSKRFMETHNFLPLYGYTKVGDNTFPNLMAALTGHHYSTYWNSTLGYNMTFDEVPLIWKQFARLGYLTALVEDMPSYSLFNYGRAGFKVPPTDYYMRPVSLLVDDDLNNHFCYKEQLGMEYYYSWIRDQVTALHRRSQPFFTFSHLADLTHNNYWAAGYADRPLNSLLHDIFQRGIHRNTFMVIFSDHGIRFGPLRRTRSGQIEERLPFIYVYVPEQFGDFDAAQIRTTLRRNQHRLSSHFDLHATLRHIAERIEPTDEPFGRSLFTEIPRSRSCQLAGISENWCLCSQYGKYSGSEEAKQILAHFVVGQVNQIVRYQPKCAQLQLARIAQVLIKTEPKSRDDSDLFTVQIVTEPGGGLFDATLQVDNSTLLRLNSVNLLAHFPQITLIGDISRVNAYGNQSSCIDDFIMEKFCYCIG